MVVPKSYEGVTRIMIRTQHEFYLLVSLITFMRIKDAQALSWAQVTRFQVPFSVQDLVSS
jgi:hypothetical protein